MMNVIRCEKGHFYDKDVFEVCPHCNPSILSTSSKPFGFPPKIDYAPSESDPDEVTGGSTIDAPVKHPVPTPSPCKPSYEPAPGRSDIQRGGTIDIFGYSDGSVNKIPQDTDELTPPEEQQPSPMDKLQDELRKNAALSPKKTVSIFGKISDEKNQTMKQSPVVGWLVCVGGPHMGQSFQISAGKNAIGRSTKNDIVLCDDPSISNDNHAWVTFEPDFGNFLFEGGGGRYPGVNGKQVLSVVELKPYDHIELGKTKLLFVNLCGENFSWNSYIEKES